MHYDRDIPSASTNFLVFAAGTESLVTIFCRVYTHVTHSEYDIVVLYRHALIQRKSISLHRSGGAPPFSLRIDRWWIPSLTATRCTTFIILWLPQKIEKAGFQMNCECDMYEKLGAVK
jgi:hypothetical protein